MRRRARLSERACDVLAAADPVSAFVEAHARGQLVKLRTSGTSAAARSVVRSTGSWVSSFPLVTSLLAMDTQSRVWVPGALSSTMNLFAATHAEFLGARVVAAPDRATHAHLTPSALNRLLDQRPDLTGIHVVVAGDRLSSSLHDRARAAGFFVSHYYGAAELSLVGWGSHEANLRPFPEVELAVRDGVLWVRSPFLCERYDDRAGAVQFDDEGFGTVGDRGSLAHGRLIVSGRGNTAVTTGGATVHVAEVESALRPFVEGELVVLGVAHQELGEVVAAVLTDARSFPGARARARTSLARTQRPRLWFEVPEPPLGVAGKVDRLALAALLVSPGPGVRRLT
ncbi:MAG TPA: AMP-binding protein [Nocardioidaceae bacterium]|nr:AMP-binding protein [Nocardioidaceae bacterium]